MLNLTHKKAQHLTLEIRAMPCDRYTNVEGLNRLMGSQLSHLDNWISNGNTYKKQTIKNMQRFASTLKDHILSQQMKNNINMDSTTVGLINARS